MRSRGSWTPSSSNFKPDTLSTNPGLCSHGDATAGFADPLPVLAPVEIGVNCQPVGVSATWIVKEMVIETPAELAIILTAAFRLGSEYANPMVICFELEL